MKSENLHHMPAPKLLESRPVIEEVTSPRNTPTLELRGVSKFYGSVTALLPTNLSVAKGEFVTLLGPSGSGKTTLLNIIAGIAQPNSGQVFIGGKEATKTPPNQRGLGMVFQNYALMPHMNVFENIAFPLRIRKLPESEIRRKVTDALELIRLPDIAHRKPHELSGGQQQRISLARCIVYNPAVILMDEPLGALDKKLREQMQLEIKRLHDELGTTMLYVTHDQEEALTMSDRIVLMNKNRIEQVAPPNELYFRPESVFAASFIGDANLFPVTVLKIGREDVTVKSTFGNMISTPPGFAVRPGSCATLLVRPESMQILRDDPLEVINELSGRLIDTIVFGGLVKYHIALADGTRVVAQELNQKGVSRPSPGSDIRLVWGLNDCLLIQTPFEDL